MSDPDLNGGSEHGCHGDSDCHGLVVKGCVVESSKRDEKENKRCVDGIQEWQGYDEWAGELLSLSRLVPLRPFQAAFCTHVLQHKEAGRSVMNQNLNILLWKWTDASADDQISKYDYWVHKASISNLTCSKKAINIMGDAV